MTSERRKRSGLADALSVDGWDRVDFLALSLVVMRSPAPRIGGAVSDVHIGPAGAVGAKVVGRKTLYNLSSLDDDEVLAWLGVGGAP